MKKIIMAILLATSLFGDQAAYIEKAQALKVVKILEVKTELRFLCEPCGEVKSQLEVIDTVEAIDVNYHNQWEVIVNGAGIDLAYTYIENHGVWVNLAMYVNEKVDSVSELLSDKNF